MESIYTEAKLTASEAEERILELRSSNPDLVIQIASMEPLPRAMTVRMIAQQTIRAMETGSLLASKPEVDLLLRLAGTRQIEAAMARCGYKTRGRKLLVAIGPRDPLERLREKLARDEAFSELSGDDIDEEGLRMVEAAALLASRI